ncbi:hypothetical protein A33Q_2857 [Indibacter alkaliphilus LW1]|uniref:Uncharacterized protein n=1 Tax=Indibacter alkaliphilus (strain CCUG 57479 / KCTC 22604 / LW1) TaxID=1189612 RepID=S2DEQ8_INDAL|nr:hypothetical protein [Indibacter alkaliphilus]EOZ95495.1 hypothetical protein A33Q_2857 [Indibacter alkaliphilus LW1]
MKRGIVFIATLMMLGSCGIFLPRPEFEKGMTERRFLRQNRDAVINTLDNGKTVYRVDRGERFYVLATFEDGKLVKLEEIEARPAWMTPQDERERENRNR